MRASDVELDELLEELVFRLLEAHAHEVAIARACAARPELEQRLMRVVERLVELGCLPPPRR